MQKGRLIQMPQMPQRNIEGYDSVMSILDDLYEKLMDGAQTAITAGKGIENTINNAKEAVPKDTTALANSIHSKSQRSGTEINSEIVADAKSEKGVPYGVFIEFGTGPIGSANSNLAPPGHSITYRTTGWVYYTSRTGFRYTEGYKPHPFLYPSYAKNKPQILKDVREAMANSLRL